MLGYQFNLPVASPNAFFEPLLLAECEADDPCPGTVIVPLDCGAVARRAVADAETGGPAGRPAFAAPKRRPPREGEINTRRVLLRLRRDRSKARGLAPPPASGRARRSARSPRRASRAPRDARGDSGDGSDGGGDGDDEERVRAAAGDLSTAIILAGQLSSSAPVYSGDKVEPRYFTLERWKRYRPAIGASLDDTASRFEGKLPSQIFRSLTTGPQRRLRAAMNAAPHVAGALAAVADRALVACRKARLSLEDTTIPAWEDK